MPLWRERRSLEEIAVRLRLARHTVYLWLHRFEERGLAALADAPRGGRPPTCCSSRWHTRRTISERRDQRAQRDARPGRPLAFDGAIYTRRNVVERCINRLQ